jgi:hypothetical protein
VLLSGSKTFSLLSHLARAPEQPRKVDYGLAKVFKIDGNKE